MQTKINKGNVKAAIKDDKAHMSYLKRDVIDDQKSGGKYKNINQTADEKHISKLAGDVKADIRIKTECCLSDMCSHNAEKI